MRSDRIARVHVSGTARSAAPGPNPELAKPLVGQALEGRRARLPRPRCGRGELLRGCGAIDARQDAPEVELDADRLGRSSLQLELRRSCREQFGCLRRTCLPHGHEALDPVARYEVLRIRVRSGGVPGLDRAASLGFSPDPYERPRGPELELQPTPRAPCGGSTFAACFDVGGDIVGPGRPVEERHPRCEHRVGGHGVVSADRSGGPQEPFDRRSTLPRMKRRFLRRELISRQEPSAHADSVRQVERLPGNVSCSTNLPARNQDVGQRKARLDRDRRVDTQVALLPGRIPQAERLPVVTADRRRRARRQQRPNFLGAVESPSRVGIGVGDAADLPPSVVLYGRLERDALCIDHRSSIDIGQGIDPARRARETLRLVGGPLRKRPAGGRPTLEPDDDLGLQRVEGDPARRGDGRRAGAVDGQLGLRSLIELVGRPRGARNACSRAAPGGNCSESRVQRS